MSTTYGPEDHQRERPAGRPDCKPRHDSGCPIPGPHVHTRPFAEAVAQEWEFDFKPLPTQSIILGLVGPSGGGKTTVCDRLKAAHGFVHFHVAEPIKRMFCALTGLGPEYTERPLIERPLPQLGGVTPRQVLEHLGSELHEVAPLAIPLAAEKRIGDILAQHPAARIIVDGIRRVSEAYTVRKMGGHVIRIAGRPIDESKPCDITQAEVVADHELSFTPDISFLHHQIDGVIAAMTALNLPPESAAPETTMAKPCAEHPELDRLLAEAKAAWERLTPEQQAVMFEEQRQSFARGNAAIDPPVIRVPPSRLAGHPATVRRITA